MNRMIGAVMSAAAVLLGAEVASAQAPVLPPEEVNILVLVDVSGSMATTVPGNQTKMDVALQQARDYVTFYKNSSLAVNSNAEYALWAFDSSYPGSYKVLRDFPSTATDVLNDLGADGTVHVDLHPQNGTPLAGAVCAASGRVAASLDQNGALVSPGYEWGKLKANGTTKVRIQRRMFIATDGLENQTATTNECYGTTSLATFANYEPGSWQAKVRNKLLSGNPSRTTVADHGLVVDVKLIFENYLTGLSYGAESGYSSSSASYTTQPTLQQALEFYSGVSNATDGSFQAVTFRADGQVDSRFPGDVDYSGCVSEADYNELLQWYGWQVTPSHPHTYWADVNGDGWVDDMDYLLISENWYKGPTC